MDERWIAAAVIFVISLHGLILNMTVAIFANKVTSLKNAFGRLCISQAAGETIFCCTYLFYYSPMVFLTNLWIHKFAILATSIFSNISIMMDNSNYAGFVLSTTYTICSLSHLLTALNRLCAICAPTRYETFFSVSNTNAMVASTWTISALSTFVINSYVDCSLVYIDPVYTFGFLDNKQAACYAARNFYSSKDFSILAVTGLLNFATILAVRRTTKAAKNMGGELHAKRLMELNLLKQAIAQAVAFATQILCVAFLVAVFNSKWTIWAFTAVAWNLLHLIDPLIIIAFNKGFRKLIRNPAKTPSTAFHSAVFNTRQTTTF